jgi:agmatine deiminase
MMLAGLILGLFLTFFQAPGSSSDRISLLPATRICAEWEPALGTLIAWPLRIPDNLVVDLTREGDLFVLVTPRSEIEAQARLRKLGIDPLKIHCIPSSVETEWTRDYGPHQVFDKDDRLTFVDPIYVDTPIFPADPPPIEKGDKIFYMGHWSGDDRTNLEFARSRALPLREFPGCLTGGNFLVDGHGIGFSTRAMVDENLTRWTEQEFRMLVGDITGVCDLRVLRNTEAAGIQHIDCWFKLLDEETILIKRAPKTHPEKRLIDENLKALQKIKTCFGRPYGIVFIDCPEYEAGRLAAYTNSLILNRSVYVPLFGVPEDKEALAVYSKALPGYKICGYPYKEWFSYDALHCRTRAVFDPEMLFISHPRLREGDGLLVRAQIVDYGRKGLVPEELLIRWRLSGNADWKTAPLASSGRSDEFLGRIPYVEQGQTVEYYISAVSRSGRRETLPRTAPEGFYSVRINCPLPGAFGQVPTHWKALGSPE